MKLANLMAESKIELISGNAYYHILITTKLENTSKNFKHSYSATVVANKYI